MLAGVVEEDVDHRAAGTGALRFPRSRRVVVAPVCPDARRAGRRALRAGRPRRGWRASWRRRRRPWAPGGGQSPRRGGAALRARGGAGRQAAGIAHASLHRRDRHPDAERGDRGRRRQARGREPEIPRGEARGHLHGRGAGPGDRRGESFSCPVDSAAAPSGGQEPRISRGAWTARSGGAGSTVPAGPWSSPTGRSGTGGSGRSGPTSRRAGQAGLSGSWSRPASDTGRSPRCRHFRGSMEWMRHDECRERSIQAGSGVVEAGCRTFGLRPRHPGTPWSRRGANAMPAPRGRVMNLRLPELPGWRANQAFAA